MVETMKSALAKASNEDLFHFAQDLYTMCNLVYDEAKERDLLNSQEFINWLDTLNEISVR